MNIRQIKYFVAVVRYGSFSSAAKNQYVTVQAVSKAIADIEKELGKELFYRENRGVRLTSFGRAFLAKAEPVLQSFQELEAFAVGNGKQIPAARKLSVVLCVPPFFSMARASASVASFLSKQLGLPVTVDVKHGASLLDRLVAGDIDALITIGTVVRDDVECSPIGYVQPALLMSKGNPLADQNLVTLDDAAAGSCAVSKTFDFFYDEVKASCADAAPNLNLEDAPGNVLGLTDYLFRKNGLVMVPDIRGLGSLFPETCTRSFEPGGAFNVPICVVYAANRHDQMAALFEHLIRTGEGIKIESVVKHGSEASAV